MALGARSLSFCTRVSPRLMQAVARALELSPQDATVTEEQTRTEAEEAALVAAGKSHTMHSHHIIGYGEAPPGFSGAIDLVPYIGGQAVWDWPSCGVLAFYMRQASIELDIPVTWGGVWDKLLSDIPATCGSDMLDASKDYVARHKAAGNPSPFVDGPHFEEGKN